ncbi:MAG: protein translocase subunit SecF [Pseudomonadales bacterium]|nr:protein translocase subunit SecF [Pseudomonadales bacterium]
MKTNIDFMRIRKITQTLSIVLLLASIVSLATRGLNFGLDFTGGTLVEVIYEPPVALADVRETLAKNGFAGSQVVNFGSEKDVLVRLPQDNTSDLGDRVLQALRDASSSDVTLQRIEYVGPQVGEELREQGGLGLLIAIIGVMIYVTVQFQFKFSLGAVAALIHDVILTLGLFSVLGLDFDLTVLAALLAVIGYSLNDTIVVADRIRENFRLLRRAEPIDVINTSLNQTLGRTIMTSATTLLVLLSLFIFGGDIIHGFATALIFGVIVGTYSSIFIAAGLMVTLKVTKEDLIVPVPENADVDNLP